MVYSETQKYRMLRMALVLAILLVIGLMAWLTMRTVPIIQQALWPQEFDCACGETFAVVVPPVTAAAAGAVVMFAVFIASRGTYFFIRHFVRSRRSLADWTRLGQRSVFQQAIGEQIIIVSKPGRQAMTMGMFRPRVYITADLLRTLTGSELKAVLRHEQVHRRRFDQLWTAVLDSFSAAWLRPSLLQEWLAASLTLRELSADEGATTEYRVTDGLSGAIVKLVETNPATDMVAFSPNNDRVQKLLDQSWQPTLPRWRWSYGIALGVALLAIGAVVRLTPPAVAMVPPEVTRACHETKLYCPRPDDFQVNVIFLRSVPQSIYVFPQGRH